MAASLSEIERLYRSRLRDYLRVAAAITGDAQTADDAVHSGFAAAVQGRRRFRGEGSLEGWLWRAVVNSALRLRRDARRQPRPEQLPEGGLAMNGHAAELVQVRAAIASLPERQRLVLFLRYYADLDYAAIAQALEISPGTVGAALHAAHAALRGRLSQVLVYD